MAIAKAPAGATNGELVRWTFGVLDAHDVSALRTMWTDATVVRFPSATVRGADAMAASMQFACQIGLLPADGSRGDRATKAAFHARTRLRARIRNRRRR